MSSIIKIVLLLHLCLAFAASTSLNLNKITNKDAANCTALAAAELNAGTSRTDTLTARASACASISACYAKADKIIKEMKADPNTDLTQINARDALASIRANACSTMSACYDKADKDIKAWKAQRAKDACNRNASCYWAANSCASK